MMLLKTKLGSQHTFDIQARLKMSIYCDARALVDRRTAGQGGSIRVQRRTGLPSKRVFALKRSLTYPLNRLRWQS